MLLNFKSRHSRLSLIKNSIISLSSVYFNSLIARLNLGAFEEFRIEEANKCGGYLLARGLSHTLLGTELVWWRWPFDGLESTNLSQSRIVKKSSNSASHQAHDVNIRFPLSVQRPIHPRNHRRTAAAPRLFTKKETLIILITLQPLCRPPSNILFH